MKLNIRKPVPEYDFFPELTSLVDVMFLLLVFFMLTTTFEKGSTKAVIVELPVAKKSIPVSKDNAIILTIKKNGEFIINENICEPASLPDVLKIAIAETKDSLVIINAHKQSPYQSIIFAYDIFQALGIKRFAHEIQ